MTVPKAKSPERLTLYVKSEHRELLLWVRQHTQAGSLSEAVFQALAELRSLVRKRNYHAWKRSHGLWKDAPEVEQAFQELEAEWRAWQRRLEDS